MRDASRPYRRHYPKYPNLAIAVYGSVVFALYLVASQHFEGWWFSSGGNQGLAMRDVSFSFLVCIVLILLFAAWAHYTNWLFTYFGVRTAVFWLLYIVFIVLLVIPWLSGWVLGSCTNLLWVPVLMAAHFVVVFFGTRRMMGVSG